MRAATRRVERWEERADAEDGKRARAAVNRAVDEMVRDMRQGGVRRFRIPAKFDATSLLRDELYVQIRLRDIKGPSRGGAICAVPPNGRVGPSILCQPGAAVMLV